MLSVMYGDVQSWWLIVCYESDGQDGDEPLGLRRVKRLETNCVDRVSPIELVHQCLSHLEEAI